VEDVLASCFLFVNIFIKDDLPTLERPMKAYSGLFAAGSLSTLVLLCKKAAFLIIMAFWN
jgi:hypothetical protein